MCPHVRGAAIPRAHRGRRGRQHLRAFGPAHFCRGDRTAPCCPPLGRHGMQNADLPSCVAIPLCRLLQVVAIMYSAATAEAHGGGLGRRASGQQSDASQASD